MFCKAWSRLLWGTWGQLFLFETCRCYMVSGAHVKAHRCIRKENKSYSTRDLAGLLFGIRHAIGSKARNQNIEDIWRAIRRVRNWLPIYGMHLNLDCECKACPAGVMSSPPFLHLTISSLSPNMFLRWRYSCCGAITCAATKRHPYIQIEARRLPTLAKILQTVCCLRFSPKQKTSWIVSTLSG